MEGSLAEFYCDKNKENFTLLLREVIPTKAAVLFGCAFSQRTTPERERLVRKIFFLTNPLRSNNQLLAQPFSSSFEPTVAIPRSRPLESSSI